MKTLWEVWQCDLPGKYNKSEYFDKLKTYWGLSSNATYNRIKSGRFTIKDVRFFWREMHIAYDYEKGFFFDPESFTQAVTDKERRSARKFGLVEA